MKPRKEFLNSMYFKGNEERLPVFEWAKWWEVTIERWEKEGLPKDMNGDQIGAYLGLDKAKRFRFRSKSKRYPELEFGQGTVTCREDYLKIKELLYPKQQVQDNLETLLAMKEAQEKDNMVTWVGIDGFFWLPRDLFGIQEHLYAFYDNPELMHEINNDLLRYNLFLIDELCKVFTPDFITIAEDMSYNNGPMISRELYNEFIKPYYLQLIPFIKEKGMLTFVDTDGDVIKLIDWLIEGGVEGILPLERQAGVDIAQIRKLYPTLRMIGGFDKTIMHKGKEALIAEFDRILPVMKSGGYIPTVDHQVPPDVSLENYRIYVELLKEYSAKAIG